MIARKFRFKEKGKFKMNKARYCKIQECGKVYYARGYCEMHYKRLLRHGNPLNGDDRYKTPELAFQAKTMPVPMSGCLIWLGSVWKGYGGIGVNGKTVKTHRYAWERVNGPIPDGLYVLHKCDVRSCCNVEHLFLGTHQDNMRDMVDKGRARAGRGVNHGAAKLSENDVQSIRLDKRSQRKIGADYGVHHSTIGLIKRRKKWRHI